MNRVKLSHQPLAQTAMQAQRTPPLQYPQSFSVFHLAVFAAPSTLINVLVWEPWHLLSTSVSNIHTIVSLSFSLSFYLLFYLPLPPSLPPSSLSLPSSPSPALESLITLIFSGRTSLQNWQTTRALKPLPPFTRFLQRSRQCLIHCIVCLFG